MRFVQARPTICPLCQNDSATMDHVFLHVSLYGMAGQDLLFIWMVLYQDFHH